MTARISAKKKGRSQGQRAGPAPKRILIVENHPGTRAAMATLINQEPDLMVCGKAGSATRALGALKKLKPDLVLTDLNMPGQSGLEFMQEVRKLYPRLPVVVISMHEARSYAEQALHAGAQAYVTKSAGGEALIQAIRGAA